MNADVVQLCVLIVAVLFAKITCLQGRRSVVKIGVGQNAVWVWDEAPEAGRY